MSRNIGQVKWFDSKSGYGFITSDNVDIFVHHSSIRLPDNVFRYLVQGEYVEFDIHTNVNDKYENQAHDVSGLNGGKLMCEIRAEEKNRRNSYKKSKQDSVPPKEMKKSLAYLFRRSS